MKPITFMETWKLFIDFQRIREHVPTFTSLNKSRFLIQKFK